MAIVQRRLIADRQGRQREACWEVDVKVLAETQAWARDAARARLELSAMAEMYPAWTLVLGCDGKPLERPSCADIAVPWDGAWRWASDGAPVIPARGPGSNAPETPGLIGQLIAALGKRMQIGLAGAIWQGLLPAPLAGLSGVEERLGRRYPVDLIAGKPWTTVPLRLVYPADFPKSEPWAMYDSAWLSALKVRQSSTLHIYAGEGRMCLFYPGQWKRGYTAADVLSRRVVNHVYSVLKHAAGASADEAFIGRIHNEKWKPE